MADKFNQKVISCLLTSELFLRTCEEWWIGLSYFPPSRPGSLCLFVVTRNSSIVRESRFLCGIALGIIIPEIILLYRNWWNTRIFPFTKKSYLHRAQWRYHFYLSHVRISVSPWLLNRLTNYKGASIPAQARGWFFWNFIQKMASRCKDGTVTGDFLDELPNFHIDTFPSMKNIQEDLPKSRKVMLKNSLRGKKMQTLKKISSTT